MKLLTILMSSLFLSGCAFAPSGGIPLAPGAGDINVSNAKPANHYVSRGIVLGQDGGGCGYYGYFGTRSNAMADLLNKAASMGADYVQITGEQDSYKSMSCETNLYKISAIAFKSDMARLEKIKTEQAISQNVLLDKQRDQSKRLMAEFIETCQAMGFKLKTDGMGMCLLTQQTRHDAALDRQQRSQLAQESLEAQNQAEYSRAVEHQEALQAQRAAQEAAAMQGIMQNMQKSITPTTRTINCNTFGNNTQCKEY